MKRVCACVVFAKNSTVFPCQKFVLYGIMVSFIYAKQSIRVFGYMYIGCFY